MVEIGSMPEWIPILVRDASGESIIGPLLPIVTGVIGVVGALTGVVIGGIVSYFIKKKEFAHQVTENNRIRKIERLEDLHARLLDLIPITADILTGVIHMVRTKSMDRKEFGDLLQRGSTAISKISSLQEIYAPESSAAMLELQQAGSRMVDVAGRYLVNPSEGNDLLTTMQGEVATKSRLVALQIRDKLRYELESCSGAK